MATHDHIELNNTATPPPYLSGEKGQLARPEAVVPANQAPSNGFPPSNTGNGVSSYPSLQGYTQQGQQGYQPQQGGMNAQGVTPLTQLHSMEAWIDCPFCHQTARTYVVEENSSMTILLGVAIGIFCICLACLPCIMHMAQDKNHFCGNCKRKVAFTPNNGVTQCVAGDVVPSQYAQNGNMAPQQQHMQNGNAVHMQNGNTVPAQYLQDGK